MLNTEEITAAVTERAKFERRQFTPGLEPSIGSVKCNYRGTEKSLPRFFSNRVEESSLGWESPYGRKMISA
jgi:hypothetical protein